MTLEKCCCCLKLRNGVVIIGVLGIIFNIIFFTVSVSTTVFFEEIRHHDDFVFGVGERSDITYKYRPTPKFWIGVVSTIIYSILSILLIAGAVKHNHFLMLPWIVVHGITLIPFALASAVFLIIGLPIYGPVYIWWCVCSAYQKVQEVAYDKFDSLSLADNLPRREMY